MEGIEISEKGVILLFKLTEAEVGVDKEPASILSLVVSEFKSRVMVVWFELIKVESMGVLFWLGLVTF